MKVTNSLIIFFLMIPYLGIHYFRLSITQPAMLSIQFLLVMVVVLILFKGMNELYFWVILYAAVTMSIAFINSSLTIGVVYSIIFLAAFSIFISYATRDFKDFIKGFYYLFAITVVFNFITLLIGGITLNEGHPIYLLGGKNKLQFVLLPSMLIFYLYSYFMYKKLTRVPFILTLISIISMFLSQSSTSIIVALLVLLFLFLPKRFIPNLKSSILIYAVAFLSLIVYRVQESNLISNILINYFHKNPTLTGRTQLWDYAIEGIKENWVFGLGRGNDYIASRFTTSESHNGILEILNFNGIVGLLIFLTIILIVAKRLTHYKHHQLSKTMSFFITLFLIIGLSESAFHSLWFWFMIAVAYNIPTIIKQYENETIVENNKIPKGKQIFGSAINLKVFLPTKT